MILSQNEAKVVADGAEDDVGGIAGATFEIAAAEMALCSVSYTHLTLPTILLV